MHILFAIWRGWTERSQIRPVASKLSTPSLWLVVFLTRDGTRVWDNVKFLPPIHSHKDSHRDTRKKIENICDEAYGSYMAIWQLSCVNESFFFDQRWTRVYEIIDNVKFLPKHDRFIPTRINMEIQERKWIIVVHILWLFTHLLIRWLSCSHRSSAKVNYGRYIAKFHPKSLINPKETTHQPYETSFW